MSEINYDNSKCPNRSDIAEGHNRFWEKLAAPGNWFTGAERVAIAKEVRQATHCNLCSKRKAALSPNSVEGAHDTVGELSHVIVEVIHRVITDSSRMTKTWFEGIIQQGLTAEEYVEVVGVTVHVFLVDEFCRGVGLPLNELPQPVAGEPSRYRPDNTVDVGAWVEMLPYEIDSGPDVDLHGKIFGNVIRSISLVPENARTLLDLLQIHYMQNEDISDLWAPGPRNLTRMQMELVATRISSINECFY